MDFDNIIALVCMVSWKLEHQIPTGNTTGIKIIFFAPLVYCIRLASSQRILVRNQFLNATSNATRLLTGVNSDQSMHTKHVIQFRQDPRKCPTEKQDSIFE